MGLWQQLKALIWKNVLIKKRSPISTFLEIFLPVLGFVLISFIANEGSVTHNDAELAVSAGINIQHQYDIDKLLEILNNLDRSADLTNPRIAFVPSNKYTADLQSYLINSSASMSTSFTPESFLAFDTEADLSKHIKDSRYNDDPKYPRVFAAIVMTTDNAEISYSLRTNSTLSPYGAVQPRSDNEPYDLYQEGLDVSGFQSYTANFHHFFQSALDEIILFHNGASPLDLSKMTAVDVEKSLKIRLQPMPARAYDSNIMMTIVSILVPMLIFMTYIHSVIQIVSALVQEKELKLRVGLQMMGLTPLAFYASWVAIYVGIYGISSICASIILSFILEHSSMILVYTIFFLFSCAIISFGCLISTIFSKVKTAANATGLFFSMFYILSVATNGGSRSMLLLSCLSPQAALTQFLQLVFAMEQASHGVTWNNLTEHAHYVSFADAAGMLLLDTVLFMLITVYLDAVLPGDNKVTKPFHYPITSLLSLCRSKNGDNNRGTSRNSGSIRLNSVPARNARPSGLLDSLRGSDAYESFVDTPDAGETPTSDNYDDTAEYEDDNADMSKIEPVPPHLRDRVGLEIKGLRKEFDTETGKLVAVNKLNLDMYEGQIFALLGHNASGKSTTISMLTGLFSPTAGTAYIHGHDIRSEMDDIQKIIGVCPQSDVLFPDLTVLEHMILYSKIKGISGNSAEIYQLLHELTLANPGDDKSHCLASQLSGGQKRKLCLALALVGSPPILFLDEPTSGMDVAAQRHVWELLLRAKKDKVVILTTHSLEEAEIADRIAILNHGKLRCCGSSLFLKHAFNVGYTLNVTKTNAQDRLATSASTPTSDCATHLTGILQQSFPWVKFLLESPREIAYQLPLSETANFPALLRHLEAQKASLHVGDYGLSVKTLTDVFLQSSSVDAKHEKNTLTKLGDDDDVLSHLWNTMSPVVGLQLYALQLYAVLAKRMQMAKRDIKHILYVVLYPAFLIGLIVFLLSSGADPEPRELTTELYPDQTPFEFISGYTPTADAYNAAISASVPRVKPVDVPVDAEKALVTDLEFRQEHFLDTISQYSMQKPRFGAVTFGDIRNTDGAFVFEATVFFNSTAPDASMVFASALTNIRMRAAKQDKLLSAAMSDENRVVNVANVGGDGQVREVLDADVADVTATVPMVKVTNHALPLRASNDNLMIMQVTMAYLMMIIISIYPATAVVGIVKERASRGKNLQYISGLSPFISWLGDYISDLVLFTLPSLFLVAFISLLGLESFMGSAWMLLAGLWLFYMASLPLSYIISYVFEKHSTAQSMVMAYHYLGAMVLIVPTMIFAFMEKPALETIVHFGCLHPAYAFTLLCLLKNPQLSIPAIKPYHDYVLIMFVMDIIIYSVLLGIVELGSINHVWAALRHRFITGESAPRVPALDEEADVKAEREAIERGDCDNPDAYPLVVRGLRKVFPGGHVAVKNLYFAVPKGSVFGFLGANGAGKSTSMSCITGELLPGSTSGPATLDMLNIFTNTTAARKHIGYCPQHDALLPTLTAREHLYLYARLKGVSGDTLPRFTSALLKELGLTKYADRTVDSFSQGTKRRLSVAVALVGNPSLVLLDEPSTGVDPASAMDMWDVIRKSMRRRSVILTSHSMLEVEALCDRIAIMVRGELKCLGTQQTLKSKYGRGWQLTVKAAHGWVDSVIASVKEAILGVQVTEIHGNIIRFHVEKSACGLIQLLEGMEGIKARLHIAENQQAMTQPRDDNTASPDVHIDIDNNMRANAVHVTSGIETYSMSIPISQLDPKMTVTQALRASKELRGVFAVAVLSLIGMGYYNYKSANKIADRVERMTQTNY